MTFKPYDFQEKDVKRIDRFGGRCLLGHEMGLGKTIEALYWLSRHPELRPVIVVCPATIKYQWQREAAHHFGIRSQVLEGMKALPRPRRIDRQCRLFIINYDILEPWLDFLIALDPQVVIADECHYASGHRTLRTLCLRTLCEGTPYILALSGTPLTNRPKEIWPILNILRPDRWPAFWNFAQLHCGAKREYGHWKFDGATRLGLLHRTLRRTVMIRRLKKDVIKDLPDKITTIVPLPLSDRSEYDRANDDFFGWLHEVGGKVPRSLKAQGLVKLGHLLRLAARLKIPAVRKWTDDFLYSNEGSKIIVFGIHHAVLKPLHEHYNGRSLIVNGLVRGRERLKTFDQFLLSRKKDILFGNIQAAGTGLSAKGVNNVAFVELPWAPGKLSQAIDRCHGIGRGKEGEPTFVHFLLAQGTVEEKLCKVLQSKDDNIATVLDGAPGDDRLAIFDLVVKEMLKDQKEQGGRNGRRPAKST